MQNLASLQQAFADCSSVATAAPSISRYQRDLISRKAVDKHSLEDSPACPFTSKELLELEKRFAATGDAVKDRAILAAGARCIRRVLNAWSKYFGLNKQAKNGVFESFDYSTTARRVVGLSGGPKSVVTAKTVGNNWDTIWWQVGNALSKAIDQCKDLPATEANELLERINVAAMQVWCKWLDKSIEDKAGDDRAEIASDVETEPWQNFAGIALAGYDNNDDYSTPVQDSSTEQLRESKNSGRTYLSEVDDGDVPTSTKTTKKFKNTSPSKKSTAAKVKAPQKQTYTSDRSWLHDEEQCVKNMFTVNTKWQHEKIYRHFNTAMANTAFQSKAGQPVQYRSAFQPHNPAKPHNAEDRKQDIRHRSFPSVQQYLEKQFTSAERVQREKGVALTWTPTAIPNLAVDLPPRPAQPTQALTTNNGINSSNGDGEAGEALDGEGGGVVESDAGDSASRSSASSHNSKTGRAAGSNSQGWTTVNDPAQSPASVGFSPATKSKKRKGPESETPTKKKARKTPANTSAAHVKPIMLKLKFTKQTADAGVSTTTEARKATIAKEIMKENEKNGLTITGEEMTFMHEIDGYDSQNGEDGQDEDGGIEGSDEVEAEEEPEEDKEIAETNG